MQSPAMAIAGLFVLKLTGGLGDAGAILGRAAIYVGTDRDWPSRRRCRNPRRDDLCPGRSRRRLPVW